MVSLSGLADFGHFVGSIQRNFDFICCDVEDLELREPTQDALEALGGWSELSESKGGRLHVGSLQAGNFLDAGCQQRESFNRLQRLHGLDSSLSHSQPNKPLNATSIPQRMSP